MAVSHEISPARVEATYHTTRHYREMFDGPSATPYRYDQHAVHGSALASEFRDAMAKLEGLLYVVYGAQPLYSEGKQWWENPHPRCRWQPEQIVETENEGGDVFFQFRETAALGSLYAGDAPMVPVRSRSGDPGKQFYQSEHHEYFPPGSVSRTAGHAVFDPASTDRRQGWHPPESVTVTWTKPASAPAPVTLELVTDTAPVVPMDTSDEVVYSATIPARPQDTLVSWYIRATFEVDGDQIYEPFVGDGVVPTFLSGSWEPEDRPENAAYGYRQFTHYNPYAGGLPELNPLCKKGTDEYHFDSSENIDYRLINLCRFVLTHLSKNFQHNPNGRGDASLCCIDMPIEFRWTGGNQPDLYRSGGKGGAGGTQPLHNSPPEPDPGDESARMSWRGIEMAWQSGLPGPPGMPDIFGENVWYGDTESWLPSEDYLSLQDDPLNPPFRAIMRDYGLRGLRAGDCIDPVHIQEIIQAVDYLIIGGLWRMEPISTKKNTPGSAWGAQCGSYASGWTTYSQDCYVYYGGGPLDDSGVDYQWGGCCESAGVDWCIPWTRPTWTECQGNSGKCLLTQSIYKTCNQFDFANGSRQCREKRFETWLNCDSVPVGSNYTPGYTDHGAYMTGGKAHDGAPCDPPDFGPWSAANAARSGSSFYLCGPEQAPNGPDDLHGNHITKGRQSTDGTFVNTGPSMGNRYGAVESCTELAPGETIQVGFGTVTSVLNLGIGSAWWDYEVDCSPGSYGGDFSLAPDIPGLGQYNWYQTEMLSAVSAGCEGLEGWVSGRDGRVDIGEWPVCRGDMVFVAIDQNLQAGIPTLYEYDLSVAKSFDDCPCSTYLAPACG